MTVVTAMVAAVAVVAVVPSREPAPERSPIEVIGEHLGLAENWADSRRAHVSLTVVDRETGERVGLRDDEPVLTASVAKLFIASQLAFLDVTGVRPAPVEDELLLGSMLAASDDSAATVLWDQMGGPAVVADVAQRYGLSDTVPPVDGLWWHTRATVSDIATFYDHLLAEGDADRLPDWVGADPGFSWSERILGRLHNWTDLGADGYDQRFGLAAIVDRDDLSAVKQGWMCCVGAQWVHLTTGRSATTTGTSSSFRWPRTCSTLTAGWNFRRPRTGSLPTTRVPRTRGTR